MFYAATLTAEEADQIAEAYFTSGKNHKKMAEILGLEYFDLNLLANTLVRQRITALARLQQRKYSLDEHCGQLKKIRELCMADANYKVALSAEIALGKAAGLYDLKKDEDPANEIDPEKLSTDEIRELLARKGVQSAGQQHVEQLPAPEDFIIEAESDMAGDEEHGLG